MGKVGNPIIALNATRICEPTDFGICVFVIAGFYPNPAKFSL